MPESEGVSERESQFCSVRESEGGCERESQVLLSQPDFITLVHDMLLSILPK